MYVPDLLGRGSRLCGGKGGVLRGRASPVKTQSRTEAEVWREPQTKNIKGNMCVPNVLAILGGATAIKSVRTMGRVFPVKIRFGAEAEARRERQTSMKIMYVHARFACMVAENSFTLLGQIRSKQDSNVARPPLILE